MSTVRCTMAQALVRYLCNQFTMADGERVPLFPGVFAIFGHGNVTCLSEALEAVTRMRLTQVLTGDGYLMNRYLG